MKGNNREKKTNTKIKEMKEGKALWKTRETAQSRNYKRNLIEKLLNI